LSLVHNRFAKLIQQARQELRERAIENEKSVRTAMGLEELEGASDDDDDSGRLSSLNEKARPNG
jgi:hypothetical protein